MTIVIVVVLALVGITIATNQLLRLRDWLQQPPPDDQEAPPPESTT